jgi:hypothetical protein
MPRTAKPIVLKSIVLITYRLNGQTIPLLLTICTLGADFLFRPPLRHLRDHESEHAGHLHVLRRGRLRILHSGNRARIINQPSVLFYPRPMRHRFQVDEKEDAELVCARHGHAESPGALDAGVARRLYSADNPDPFGAD